MSPRRNHPKRRGATPAHNSGNSDEGDREFGFSGATIEEHHEGNYMVRKITGSSSNKPYRCPGCDQLIPTATPHFVAWPEDDLESRRHWHTPCWNKKKDRAPRVQRTRDAPRY